jgi:ubiquitin C-terminal hydrolase
VRAFGALLMRMWGGEWGWVAPREFKSALGKHASQFLGFDQQDSQELIAYLLDGIHEDLNRGAWVGQDGEGRGMIAQDALQRVESVRMQVNIAWIGANLGCLPRGNGVVLSFVMHVWQ